MQYKADSPEAYIECLPEDRQAVISAMRDAVRKNIPAGFEEVVAYGHMGWVVPHELYPPGYHCDPKQPLPFIGIGSQKNHIALYHMGIYSDPKLLAWFESEWPKHSNRKLDMGKSCIRFKKPEHVTISLIAELAAKMTPSEWIERYEASMKR